MRLFNSQ